MLPRRLLPALAGLALGLLPSTAAAVELAPLPSTDPPPSPHVVVVAPGPLPCDETVASLLSTFGLTASHTYGSAVCGFAADLTPTQVSALAALPEVGWVEPDAPVAGAGRPQPPAGETVPPGVRRVGGTVAGAPRGPAGTAVAVLDTGLDLSGDELNAQEGINCVSNRATSSADDNGHGTAIGGVIGARADGDATVGVAPATPLVSVKVLNRSRSSTLSSLLCGLDWTKANAAARGIGVINMSIAAPGAEDGACGSVNGEALHRAICGVTSAGLLVVAAAGNASADLARTAPAAYGETLAVTAMSDTDGGPGARGGAPDCLRGEADDRYAAYSNFAVAARDAARTLAAPGTCILSTGLGGGTATYYGTSLAAPHVAAAAALCLRDGTQAGPCAGLRPADAIARLRADAVAGPDGFAGDPVAPLPGRTYGPLVSAAGY